MKYLATPLSNNAPCFEFETIEEYTEGLKLAIAEEFKISILDTDITTEQLFIAADIDLNNLEDWINADIEDLEHFDKAKLFYLLEYSGCSFSEALDKIDEVCIVEDNLLDAATMFFDDCYLHDIPKHVQSYIDYDGFANDCRLGGDMCEFEFDSCTYTVTNANSI